MTQTTDTYQLLRAFVDELARCGMRAACTSPGSRSAPLVLSLAAEPRLRCYSHIDERCAGFFALGLAKASGLPVAVACTSGTAAAQLVAAAIEAREARVPLLLLTADRPAELRDNGAGQAIDQIKLYGASAKWFVEVSVREAGEEQLRWMRTLACRAYATALEGRPGAVHLNFPLYEPLTLDSETTLPADDTARSDGRPFVSRPAPAMLPDELGLERLHERVQGARRGVIVAGRHERPTPLAEAARAFAETLGWPLLADPMSGARRGGSAVAHYDALLRDERLAGELEADVILRVGDLPVSKPLRTWLTARTDAEQIALDPEGAWQDPAGLLHESLPFEPAVTLARLTERSAAAPPSASSAWLTRWLQADSLAATALADAVDYATLSEPVVARTLGESLPGQATLFIASSMPVRDIETFWPVRSDPPRVLCNRGANGIDGTVSSAFGAAAASDGPVVLLIGDVALAHDVGGLIAAGRLGLKLTIVLLDNGGGGIFDFLPVSGAAIATATVQDGEDTVYTRHVATPTGLDFKHAATLYGLDHERADDLDGFRAALSRALAAERSAIVEVRGERAANVALHRRAWAELSAKLRSAGQ
ncbi:MAG TPA: 2-succinyl-5-enolpyruvyl-6-hydroxy-3-cyclohexene-1-carboxylic-acid synthase [Solirubrobacteraceae bacterium]|jgi:2-succinyl-5-enolpyruvyl-6-hydroxy-3-cyclohexene-1-carboxylate synthase